ncbi:MAG TPA: alpha/beta fold hydrolase [Ilumatobacteraceae bacterium]|jgi:carboxylesterase
MSRVLCLHGLGGTGATMWTIVAACIDAGCTTLAPTLPGHGTDPADLTGITWDDWMEAARAWDADFVVGQSMGAALALQLAAEGRARGVVCINPIASNPDALEGLEWRRSRGQSWIEVEPDALEEIAYSRLPIQALIEMNKGVDAIDLSVVEQPVLLITSANDAIVDPASSDVIAAALPRPPARLSLARSGHVATLDVERDLVQRAVIEFVSGSTGSRPTRGR